MKNISSNFSTHLAGNWLTLCMCFKIEREDGTIFYLAGHDSNLTIEGNVYESIPGFSASETDSKLGLSVDNSEITLPFKDGFITKADVIANLFHKAKLDVFWVNWADISMGGMYEAKNWLLGKAIIKEFRVVFEVRSLSSYLEATVTDVISPACPYIFGVKDVYRSKCPANVDSYKSIGTVTSVVSRTAFYGSNMADLHTHGKVAFTSGNNSGYSMEITYAYNAGPINLFMPMPYDLQVGDSYEIWQGCDKRYSTCQFYGFSDDFGGEPAVPSKDVALDYEL